MFWHISNLPQWFWSQICCNTPTVFFSKILEDYALEKTKPVKMKSSLPRYNNEVKGLKRDRRKPGWRWFQHRDDPVKSVTYKEYELVRNRYRSVKDETKTEYFWKGSGGSLRDMAGAFYYFFVMKIEKIRNKLENHDPEPTTVSRMPAKRICYFPPFCFFRRWCQGADQAITKLIMRQWPNTTERAPRLSHSHINTFSEQIPSD